MAVPLVNSIQIDRSQSLFYFSAKVTWLVQDVSALSTRTNVEYGIHIIFMDGYIHNNLNTSLPHCVGEPDLRKQDILKLDNTGSINPVLNILKLNQY